MMRRSEANVRIGALITLLVGVGVAALYGLLRPNSSGCIMTYMFPTYIPIPTPSNVTAMRYGLYLYHEGWKKIDFKEHIAKLSGVPVLFIPGNSGSYKQVRSLAAVSDRAYQGGPLDQGFYQEASKITVENTDIDISKISLPNQYAGMLDWFAVDLEGEHSATDGRILEEHTEYVVYAIHRILDQYKESYDARLQEGAASSGKLAKSVILVGHSMGGFVARAALVHPHLRKSAVETILTLSTPHQSPPLALQPSLGQFYARINQEWRKGYEVQTSRSGRYISDGPLSRVVVVSISGGYNDYQVRSKLESLDGIVPPTHGFMITSSAMKNVWLSMEHQVILWCNQLVVQVSHTLLSLIDTKTGQPISDVLHRVAIFMKMFHSGIPQHFDLTRQSQFRKNSTDMALQDGKTTARLYGFSSCPSSAFENDGIERDLYIQTTTVTILAMDGRRRWLDIDKPGSNGNNHFVFVTNLAPCSGVRIHLWPEKGTSLSEPVNKRAWEVTSRMVLIPSGPAPRQVEPGSQTEQPPPSAVFWLNPSDMRGFRFLTISVAPQQTLSGRPPPATSMGVGQFFNPQEGKINLSSMSLVLSMFSKKEMILREDHPLVFNLSFPISLGLLPASLAIQTTGCGIKKSEFSEDEPQDIGIGKIIFELCKLRCFPPVALAWDFVSGLHVYPNLDSKTIIVDSSPSLWASTKEAEKTTVLLMVDPHCSYQTSLGVSFTTTAGRFLLVYFSQITGLSISVVFFALMRQAYAWELDLPIPSMLSALELNLRLPFPFLFAMLPVLFALSFSFLSYQSLPPVISFTVVSVLCYLLSNAIIVLLIAVSHLVFYVAAIIHVFIKKRFQTYEGNSRFSSTLLSFKVVRIIRTNPLFVTALVASILVCLVHPALGLFVLLLVHAVCCHNALSSHLRTKEFLESGKDVASLSPYGGKFFNRFSSKAPDSPKSGSSYIETQLEIFHHRHGLFVLHLLAALSFVPSLLAWLQRIGIRHSFPWLLDSLLCLGVLLHGICDSKPEFNFFLFPVPGVQGWEFRLSSAYLIAGYFSFLSGLALAPYRAFYAMATVGVISFAYRIVQRRNRVKGDSYYSSRKHSHRH
ncbi:hypothetical protein Leryth_009335 [Lithospermum erythrorhizon]|nr:hypothetical protein Leryth_009335 [Lithospermum erythrorhizon]